MHSICVYVCVWFEFKKIYKKHPNKVQSLVRIWTTIYSKLECQLKIVNCYILSRIKTKKNVEKLDDITKAILSIGISFIE